MKLNQYIRILAEMEESKRSTFIDHLEIKNYGSNELTETDMWILTNVAKNSEYLKSKLREAEELSLDKEAPEEASGDTGADSGLDTPTEGELSLDTSSKPTPEGGNELSLDTPAEDELSLDTPSKPTPEGGNELSLDVSPNAVGGEDSTLDTSSETDDTQKKEIQTSKVGIGILPLLAEIQKKLANGRPSEVEIAALKAIKKLVD